MIISFALPVMVMAAFALIVPSISLRMGPGAAIWMLSAGGLASTACGAAATGVVVGLGAGQFAPLARIGHWSGHLVGLESPFQQWSLWVAASVLAVAGVRTAVALLTHGRRLGAAWSASRASPASIVVMADDALFAFAVPGWPGRIVISRGLLRGLDPSSRQAVLAHEETHLVEHHDLHRLAVEVAIALNPLMSRSRAALKLACERRADEVAARTVGDRGAVARAIAAVGSPEIDSVAWSVGGADATTRVQALLCPPRIPRVVSLLLLGGGIAAVVASAACVLWLGHDLHSVLVSARR